MPAVISHKAVEESCNYRKGLHKLCFRVKAAHSASQGSAEVASSPKPWGLKLFQADVRNEMHTCVHGRDTESPSCAGSPSVSSSVSQHSRPFTVHHTAAHDPHTHQPIKERGRAQNRHFVSRLWLHTKAIIDLFSLKNKSFFMKSRALSFCPPESSLHMKKFTTSRVPSSLTFSCCFIWSAGDKRGFLNHAAVCGSMNPSELTLEDERDSFHDGER